MPVAPTGGRPARRRSSRSTPSRRRRASTLFIVPWPAAPTRSGTACASAPRHTSATRWLTSTLPAPTATGGTRGDDRARAARSRAPAAARRRSRGWSGSVDRRAIANATALTVTASTAFTLPGRCASVPVKSNVTPSPSTVHRHHDARRRLLLGRGPGGVEHVVERATRRRAAPRSAARMRRSP